MTWLKTGCRRQLREKWTLQIQLPRNFTCGQEYPPCYTTVSADHTGVSPQALCLQPSNIYTSGLKGEEPGFTGLLRSLYWPGSPCPPLPTFWPIRTYYWEIITWWNPTDWHKQQQLPLLTPWQTHRHPYDTTHVHPQVGLRWSSATLVCRVEGQGSLRLKNPWTAQQGARRWLRTGRAWVFHHCAYAPAVWRTLPGLEYWLCHSCGPRALG